ncbi:hypothetical protein [Helicobacter acinonychis]|uniref:hypothetical protein n=1 Tax=Helicobacter acinonychis TaxID=212 RepID=UPI0002E20BE2|nr:hypothetical protein [Helicobacter acinonychis]
MSLWQDYGFDTAIDMIVDYYSGSVDAIFSQYLMSEAENVQRNKELEADIKKLYPKIGYLKANGVYLGSKEPSFLIYALQESADLLTTIRGFGYKHKQDSVLHSRNERAWLYFTTPLKFAFFE